MPQLSARSSLPSVAYPHYYFEEHEGRTIVIVDYRETDRAMLMERVRAVRNYILGQPLDSVLQLTFVHDEPYPTVWMQAVIEAAREQKPYMRASAVAGLQRLRPVLNAINRIAGRKIRMFDDERAAIAYLLDESDREP